MALSEVRVAVPMDRTKTESSDSIPVMILADNPLSRSYMCSVLQRDPDYGITVLAGVDEACETSLQQVIVIEDLSVRGLQRWHNAVRESHPDARYLAVTSIAQPSAISELLQTGFQGFVFYSNVDQNLNAAVRLIADGYLWIPAGLRVEVGDKHSGSVKRDFAGLTPRERAVSALLEKRLANKQIAHELGISERTVKFHVSNIFNKLGVHERFSIYEAARFSGAAL
jgi:DNA-binding NarL/FixJ family response regulator